VTPASDKGFLLSLSTAGRSLRLNPRPSSGLVLFARCCTAYKLELRRTIPDLLGSTGDKPNPERERAAFERVARLVSPRSNLHDERSAGHWGGALVSVGRVEFAFVHTAFFGIGFPMSDRQWPCSYGINSGINGDGKQLGTVGIAPTDDRLNPPLRQGEERQSRP
jgi:hypothetical protein